MPALCAVQDIDRARVMWSIYVVQAIVVRSCSAYVRNTHCLHAEDALLFVPVIVLIKGFLTRLRSYQFVILFIFALMDFSIHSRK